jgi:hypothetical protein
LCYIVHHVNAQLIYKANFFSGSTFLCLHLLQNRNDCNSTKLQEFRKLELEFQETRVHVCLQAADTVHAKIIGAVVSTYHVNGSNNTRLEFNIKTKATH